MTGVMGGSGHMHSKEDKGCFGVEIHVGMTRIPSEGGTDVSTSKFTGFLYLSHALVYNKIAFHLVLYVSE